MNGVTRNINYVTFFSQCLVYKTRDKIEIKTVGGIRRRFKWMKIGKYIQKIYSNGQRYNNN